MKKIILAAMTVASLSSVAAKASITVNAVHDTAIPNSIESYFIKADSNYIGSSNIFINSAQDHMTGESLSMNGLLSVWQQIASNWVLIGANDEAPRTAANNVNVYGVPVHDWDSNFPAAGISDPGLTLNLTAGATYLIIQSDTNNGPTSLSNDQNLLGAPGQTMAIGSPLQAALWGTYKPFEQQASGLQLNNYTLTVTGNVTPLAVPPAAVPLPAAVWLFSSALAGLGVIGRKKMGNQLVA